MLYILMLIFCFDVTVATAMPHPLARLCNLILFATKDDFMAILDTIIMDVFKDINFQLDDDKTTITKKRSNKQKK